MESRNGEENTHLEALDVKYDGTISIAEIAKVSTVQVKNIMYQWSDFVAKFQEPVVTLETQSEYKKFNKAEQLAAKDVGGFIGAEFKEERRSKQNVLGRSLLTLDIDDCPADIINIVKEIGFCALTHTTHSSTPEDQRCRVIMPLSRMCSLGEYDKVYDYVVDKFFDYLVTVDPTSKDPSHIMFWPSISLDAMYGVDLCDAPWIEVEAILGKATSDKQNELAMTASVLSDPGEKQGIIGQFCKTFTIQAAIETFLKDIYVPEADGRYTYTKGTGKGGLVVYEDGKFAYSNHSTDPACELMLNSFDLVRIHRFPDLTPKESTKQMAKLAKRSLDQTAANVEVSEADNRSIDGITQLILEDPHLHGMIAYDEFSYKNIVLGDLPWMKAEDRMNPEWQAADDAQLFRYLEKTYNITSAPKLEVAKICAFSASRIHPVRKYLEGLEWDTRPRLDALFITHLGAEDTAYTRAVARKALVGAVARVMQPGCKHDYTPVLVGPQGTGKSTLVRSLGKYWFSDSLYDMGGKNAYEQLLGAWIIEFGELAALNRSEVQTVKHFITKQSDHFRKAYGRDTHEYPRQCVFFGTTNEVEFLRDPTGARRFWPVEIKGHNGHTLDVDQIWAEALYQYKRGEKNYFETSDMEEYATAKQEEFQDHSYKTGMIANYLDMPIPSTWADMSIEERQFYIKFSKTQEHEYDTLLLRDYVCAAEVWVELFGGDISKFSLRDSREIKDSIRSIKGWKEIKYHDFGSVFGKQRGFKRVV